MHDEPPSWFGLQGAVSGGDVGRFAEFRDGLSGGRGLVEAGQHEVARAVAEVALEFLADVVGLSARQVEQPEEDAEPAVDQIGRARRALTPLEAWKRGGHPAASSPAPADAAGRPVMKAWIIERYARCDSTRWASRFLPLGESRYHLRRRPEDGSSLRSEVTVSQEEEMRPWDSRRARSG